MNRSERITPVIMVGVFIMLILELGFVVYETINYEERKEYGNARWSQVDEILTEYDTRIKELEELCDNGRNN